MFDKELVIGYSSGSFLSKAIERMMLLAGSFHELDLLKSAFFRRLDIKCFNKSSTLTKDKKEIEGC